MSDVQRSSDVVETYSARAFAAGVCGVVALIFGAPMIYYAGAMIGLGWVLTIGGCGSLIYCIYEILKAKKVTGVRLECPYCKAGNVLTEHPNSDFSCRSCHRMVPVDDGVILEVNQVRCGFCNTLNYYSARSFGLICENCDREIPIAGLEGGQKRIQNYAVKDDSNLYILTLTSVAHQSEDLITALQHMLALNRNQVKDILSNLPQPLLQGIPRKKAELLTAQLAGYDAKADYTPVDPV